MINAFYKQFFVSKNKKKKTICIKGITNSGKSEFVERIMEIFPTEKYVQLVGSNFDADYKKQNAYDHTKYHPSFIFIEEG